MIRYVLITPARNEARFIELTLLSVISQTALPIKWIIVNDGSSDGTDDIVRKYINKYDWIELIRMPERKERHFAGKVAAFNTGYERARQIDYDIIANLDADVSFEKDYFEFLLNKFVENCSLGVAGTPFREGNHQYDYRFTSVEHVSGACQLFRRECYAMIGGYSPIESGGIDLVAVIKARMHGWQTKSFPEKYCTHHRLMSTESHKGLSIPYQTGRKDYLLGGHPLWEVFRSLYQMKNKPIVIRGIVLLIGYFWAAVTISTKSVSDEIVHFRRKEQIVRLRMFFRNLLFVGSSKKPYSP